MSEYRKNIFETNPDGFHTRVEKKPFDRKDFEDSRESQEFDRRHEHPKRDEKEVHKILEEIKGIGADKKIFSDIVLTPEQTQELQRRIAHIQREDVWKLPSLFRGNKTATEYDSQVSNFSTQTHLVKLADGTKLFAVHNYRSSFMHRALDNFMKRMTDCRMTKAGYFSWKRRFEKKSQIPTIPNDTNDVVVLPFIPNINAYDLVNRADKISDVGECAFARGIDEAMTLDIFEDIIKEVERIHKDDVTWGEVNLQNVIVDKDKKIHICDPETAYDETVPMVEQKARDLFNLVISSTATIGQTYNTDYSMTIKRMLDSYKDKEVIVELQRICAKKMSWREHIFFGYTQVRLAQRDKKQHKDIRQAIVDYV